MAEDANHSDFLPISAAGSRNDPVERSSQRGEPPGEFEGYQILEELPRGGQAIVYKALHEATKTEVALKVLPPGLLLSARARRQFEREIDLIASLEHPYIVRIRDSGIAKGQYYFAMEYVRGKPLDEYVGSQGLSLRSTMQLFLKACEGAAYAHQHGVIHRDLKPSNILVDDRGDPHILDFGLAKATGPITDEASVVSITGEIKGTLKYMSPEQAAGHSRMVGTPSDVYALGVVFYRILVRESPYDVSGATIQTLRNIQCIDPVRPRQILGRFDSEVETILLKALAKDPADRYHSAAALGEDIQRWLDHLPINARRNTMYVLWKLARRHALSSTTIALLVLILIGFTSAYYLLYGEVRRRNVQLEKSVKALLDEKQSTERLNDELQFARMLDLWHHGRYGQVESESKGSFKEDGREIEAIRFLLDDRPLSQKAGEFQQRLGGSEPFFASMVIAEHHLRDGNEPTALRRFRQSRAESGEHGDIVLRARVEHWVMELGESEPAGRRTGTTEGGE